MLSAFLTPYQLVHISDLPPHYIECETIYVKPLNFGINLFIEHHLTPNPTPKQSPLFHTEYILSHLRSPPIHERNPPKMSDHSDHDHPTSIPLHLCFFLSILFAFVGMTWYANYESIFEGFFDQLKLVLMVSPLLLLLAVHLLGTLEKSTWFFLALPEQDAIHRAGSTPWGVGMLLVLLFFMISYHSDFRERWFPILS